MAISSKVAVVLQGFIQLSQDERREFIDRLNELISGDAAKRKDLREEVLRKSLTITFGPAPQNTCPCCGR